MKWFPIFQSIIVLGRSNVIEIFSGESPSASTQLSKGSMLGSVQSLDATKFSFTPDYSVRAITEVCYLVSCPSVTLTLNSFSVLLITFKGRCFNVTCAHTAKPYETDMLYSHTCSRWCTWGCGGHTTPLPGVLSYWSGHRKNHTVRSTLRRKLQR